YPISQACDNTGWVIERRVMPMRIPVMDRALLDLAFRVPISLKTDGQFFERAAIRLLGKGRRIPNANDGVRPGSGHIPRLLQRAVRKTQRQVRTVLAATGVQLEVPHSWHDFPRYLEESPVIADLISQHGCRLTSCGRNVFENDPTALFRDSAV